MAKEKMVIDYNDKMDTVWITVDREKTPRLFESLVHYLMDAFNIDREEAEKKADARKDWKIAVSLVMENGNIFGVEYEMLYSDECRVSSPYSGRLIRLAYDGIKRYH